MSLSFPYVKEPLKVGFVFRPKIPAVFSYRGKVLEIVGWLDTGSDVTIIPKSHAEFLGLDLTGKIHQVGGIGGGILECVETKVNIKVGKFRLLNKSLMIPVRGELKDVVFGRKPFFEEFDITFRENARRVELRKIRH